MMTDNLDRTRRRLLVTGGGLALVGLAGCVGAPPGGTASGAGAPSPTPEPTDSDGHPEDEHHDDDDDHHEEVVHHDDEETHEEDEGHGTEGPAEHVEVLMQSTSDGEHFHPHVAWIDVGGSVTFVNESGTHSATAYHPDNGKSLRIPEGAESFDSGVLMEAGATFERTFETEGVYDVYCAPHEQLGMIGSVVVGTPPHEGQPGMTDPDAEMSETVANKIDELNEQVNTMLGHEH